MSTLTELFTLPKLFEKSIESNYRFLSGSTVQLEEEGKTYKFKIAKGNAIGFRIEMNKDEDETNKDEKKLKLFKDGPLYGIAKMCDALFVIQYKNKDFILAVEIKTKNKDDYKEQIRNGWRFCEWIVHLLKDYKHYSGEPQYLGLLIWQPNSSQINKPTTTRMKDKSIAASPMIIYEKIGTTIELRDYLKTS